MTNKVSMEQIYKEIYEFNIKKNEIVNFINQNQLTQIPISIPEISFDKNSISVIKKQLNEIREEISVNIDNTNINLIPNRYTQQFNNSDDIFWGIGLENECYLQAEPKEILGKNIISMLGRERYSVDYTKNYDISQVKHVMSQVYLPDKLYKVSQMINAHSFNKMDVNGQHIMTYEREPKPNPNFKGKTVFEEWVEYDNEISEMINSNTKTKTNIFFDGDTIEFITEKFYKNTVVGVVGELSNNKNKFIDKFNKFKNDTNLWKDLKNVKFIDTHPGINIFNSQPNKIVFFNNSTIHLHLTLPTKITNGLILNNKLFIETHAKAIKLLQWFEPFFICTLGSPDLLQSVFEKYNSSSEIKQNYFSSGSMRATISRYIGIGTFDTDKMIMGKLLTNQIDQMRQKNVMWWRDMINEDLLYKLPENEIGYDFNYGKHYQSGLEFRILDGIPMDILKSVLDIIILICEHSYSYAKLDSIENCSKSQTWNNIVYKSMVYGYDAKITKKEQIDILQVLNINISIIEKENLEDFYYGVLENLMEIYNRKDTHVIKYMSKDFKKINRWKNFNLIQNLAHKASFNIID